MKRYVKYGFIGSFIGILISLAVWIFMTIENQMEIQPILAAIYQLIGLPLWFMGSLIGVLIFYIVLGFAVGALIGHALTKRK